MNNAYTQYKSRALSTMPQGELLIKVFDELIKQLLLAELAFKKDKKGVEHECLMKAQAILSVLAESLDDSVPVSKELRQLYIFFAHELRDANLKKDHNKVTAILPLIKDLRGSFEQAEKMSRTGQQVPAMGV